MVDALLISAADLRLYAFAIGNLIDAIADADSPTEGCTNVVAGERAVRGHPLVCKNCDVSGAGLRPQAVVTYPRKRILHAFTTISTCGTVLVF